MNAEHDIWQWILMSVVVIGLALIIWRMFAMHGQSVRKQTEMDKDIERLKNRQIEDREALKELRDKNSDNFKVVFSKLDENANALSKITGHLEALIRIEETRK